jgi:t-SNARE complex subunit (syntaxin)
MREQKIQNISRMQAELTDLYDMLRDRVPERIAVKIRQKIQNIEDAMFDEQEALDSLEKV